MQSREKSTFQVIPEVYQILPMPRATVRGVFLCSRSSDILVSYKT